MRLRYRLQKSREALIISVSLSSLGAIVEGVALTFYGSIILATDFFHWVLDTIVEVMFLFSIYYASRVGKRFPWSIIALEFLTSIIVMIVVLGFYGFYFFNYVNSLMQQYSVSTVSPLAAIATAIGGIITLTVFVLQRRNYRKYSLEILRIDSNHALIDTASSFFATFGIILTAWLGDPTIEIFATLIIMMFIIHSIFEIFKDTFKVLSGSNLDHEITDRVRRAIEERLFDAKLKNVEARKVGSFYIVSTDIFLDPNTTISKAHSLRRKIVNLVKEVSDLIYHVDVKFYPSLEYRRVLKKQKRRS
ncbi:MAG: cation transporter [Candidatus Nezhaarchaeales archaeon]